MHQHVAATLFTGFDDVAFQLVQASFTRIDNTVLTCQRNKGSNTQFGELFDQKLATISLGQRSGQFERKAQLARRRQTLDHFESGLLAMDAFEASGVFMAVAVEEGDLVAGAEPAHHGKMVSFRSFEIDRAGLQRTVEVISFGHL